MPRRIRPRTDTSTNWTAKNPTLALNEIGFESNTGRYKIGDGSTQWTSLSYFDVLGPRFLKSYTVAQLEALTAANYTGSFAVVSDEIGGLTTAFCDGTNWRRSQDRTIISDT
jgi:hypothetical protein